MTYDIYDIYSIIGYALICAAALLVIGTILYLIFRSPFHYPYFEYYFDVSGKRNPDVDDLIDNFLNRQKFFMIERHRSEIEEWKLHCQEKIKKSMFKKYRRKQYKKSLDDGRAYVFCLTRQQTRYTQTNYVKTPYQVTQTIAKFSYDYEYLLRRDRLLKGLKNECTIKEYCSKNQRKLVTKELRRRIMERDNYTCQICGKYMPDMVGLHIDHIRPIAKGGKTVPSNLQVLCSRCNGRKSCK